MTKLTTQGGWAASGFGARLRVLRERAGLSQAKLAKAAGCYHGTIAKMEQGLQEPAWPLVLAICDALGVSCDEFRPDRADASAAEEPKESKPAKPKPEDQAEAGKLKKRGRPKKDA
jgi:transcriptional regulator with XRE-family HTH domain